MALENNQNQYSAEDRAADRQERKEQQILRQVMEFGKMAPHYYLGEGTWAQYIDSFQEVQYRYPQVQPKYAKNILYTSLKGQAFALASPDYNPRQNQTYKTMTFEQYVDAVGELYEPASETEQTKLEFEDRTQRPGEHVSLYYRDKKNLFYRAYAEAMRDFNMFYNKVIAGLINQEMKNGMRLFTPEPLKDQEAFRNRLLQMATIVRRRFLDGELTETEALGAEAHTSRASYQNYPMSRETNLGYKAIKSEPIYSINEENSVNAFTREKKSGRCFYCHNKVHFIAECPRKAAGLGPAIQEVQPKQEEADSEGTNVCTFQQKYKRRNNYFDARSGSKFGPRKFGNKPMQNRQQQLMTRANPSTNQVDKRRFNRRIAVVYENEEGTTMAEESDIYEIDDGEEQIQQEEQQAEDGINAIELEERYQDGFSESDYLPGVFLGM